MANNMTIIQIAWAAGIYEGEGSFDGKTVSVPQKDPWLMYELQRLFGGKVFQRPDGCHYWLLGGSKGRGFLLSIFTLLSPRRKEQILKHPLFFKDSNFIPKGTGYCSKGHELTPENTYAYPRKTANGTEVIQRICKKCKLHKDTPEDRMIKAVMLARGVTEEEAENILKDAGIQ